ncbi:MAG: hypothetical protein ABR964_14415 [Tepidisphaeraceae bacterium]|jgi:hypothetical protein
MSSDENDPLPHDEPIEPTASPGDEEFAAEGDFVDPPRSGINQNTLALMVLVAVVVGVTYVMVLRSGPGKAAAADAQAEAAGATINSFLSGGADNVRVIAMMLQKTETVVNRFRAYPSTKQVPLEDLHTNPFHFGRAKAARADLDDAAVKRQRQEQLESILAAAKQLRLQSILIGDARKSCIIDGKVYTQGQSVGRFTLLEIGSRSIIVQSDGVRLEIAMPLEHPR